MSRKKRKEPRTVVLPKKATERIGAHKVLVAWALGIATVLGGIAAALTFLPRVTITPNDTDPRNPLNGSFTITNTGFIPLRRVNVTMAIGEILMKPLPFDELQRTPFPLEKSSRFTVPQWNNHTLGMDEKFTIAPNRILDVQVAGMLSGADIAIVAKYQPWIIPWPRESGFRFITHRQANGDMYWFSYPLK